MAVEIGQRNIRERVTRRKTLGPVIPARRKESDRYTGCRNLQ